MSGAESDGVVLHPRHLFDVIFDLVQNGHAEDISVVGAAIFSVWRVVGDASP